MQLPGLPLRSDEFEESKQLCVSPVKFARCDICQYVGDAGNVKEFTAVTMGALVQAGVAQDA
mgnify:CR=1 FL=1